MEVSCDPEQAYSEGCCELSNVVSQLPFWQVFTPSVKDGFVVLKRYFHLSHCYSVAGMQR